MSADGTTSCAKLHCAGLPAPPWKRPCEPANASARRCFTPFSLLLDWSQFKEFVDAQPLKAVINLEAQAKWIGLSDSAVHGLNRETTTDAPEIAFRTADLRIHFEACGKYETACR